MYPTKDNDRSSYLLSGGGRFINGVETIEEIPKSVKRNGLDFILSNKVVMIMHYVKKETLVEVEPNSLLRS